jgi:hypothetical protein
MDFSEALRHVKAGHRITRHGWNGTGMYVVHQAGYPHGIPINTNTATATGIPEGTICAFRPYLLMLTAQQDFVPWIASQSDLLADDWASTAP